MVFDADAEVCHKAAADGACVFVDVDVIGTSVPNHGVFYKCTQYTMEYNNFDKMFIML